MIRDLKPLSDHAAIQNETIRRYLAKFESDLLRGMNTLLILDVLHNYLPEGGIGTKINVIIQEKTQNMIVLEEATLYTLLSAMTKEHLLTKTQEFINEKSRKIYRLTQIGKIVYQYGLGLFFRLSKFFSPKSDEGPFSKPYILCPNCSTYHEVNLINPAENLKTCIICGSYLDHLIKEYLKKIQIHDISEASVLTSLETPQTLSKEIKKKSSHQSL